METMLENSSTHIRINSFYIVQKLLKTSLVFIHDNTTRADSGFISGQGLKFAIYICSELFMDWFTIQFYVTWQYIGIRTSGPLEGLGFRKAFRQWSGFV